MRRSSTTLAILAIFIVTMLAGPLAGAYAGSTTIYIGRGISTARLGMNDATAAKRIGHVSHIDKDTAYDAVSWIRYFGSKVNGRYALEMHSDSHHKVFMFFVYSSRYVTTKHIHVGSTESALKKAYGGSLKRGSTSVYTRYYIGTRPRTTFYVKSGKVAQIAVSKF